MSAHCDQNQNPRVLYRALFLIVLCVSGRAYGGERENMVTKCKCFSLQARAQPGQQVTMHAVPIQRGPVIQRTPQGRYPQGMPGNPQPVHVAGMIHPQQQVQYAQSVSMQTPAGLVQYQSGTMAGQPVTHQARNMAAPSRGAGTMAAGSEGAARTKDRTPMSAAPPRTVYVAHPQATAQIRSNGELPQLLSNSLVCEEKPTVVPSTAGRAVSMEYKQYQYQQQPEYKEPPQNQRQEVEAGPSPMVEGFIDLTSDTPAEPPSLPPAPQKVRAVGTSSGVAVSPRSQAGHAHSPPTVTVYTPKMTELHPGSQAGGEPSLGQQAPAGLPASQVVTSGGFIPGHVMVPASAVPPSSPQNLEMDQSS